MRCLVLGGGGFLGSHLCDALLAEGHEVRIFDRPNLTRYREFLPEEKIEWFEGDFINPEDLSRVVPGCNVIFHLVSSTLPKSSNENPAYDVDTNVIGTLRLLDLAVKEGISKVVFISSGGTVYGIPQEVPIQEDHPTDPICSYGISKLAIEKYLSLYNKLHGLNFSILRLANPYGERQRATLAQGAVAVFINNALKNEPIEIWGDGSVVRDYIHVSDAVSAMLKTISYEGETHIFNIGSGFGKSLNELVAEVGGKLRNEIVPIYRAGRPLDVPINILDVTRAREILKWEPKVSFGVGIDRTINWLKDNK